MTGRRLGLWLCVAAVTLGLWAPAAFAMTFEGAQPEQEPAPVKVYRLTLDAQAVGGGENLSYETVALELAGNPYAVDYYPGELIVELTGQIVVEDGGCLTIGTLSVGNEKERGPVLRGTCSPDGLIVVRPGGRLVLKNVTLDLDGEGLFIVQDQGGSVELTDMEPEDGLVAWAPPAVDNTHQQPADLWLEEGTVLTEAMLPDTLDTYIQHRGAQRWERLALRWDMDGRDGQTKGERTLTGTFLDANGAALISVRPLSLAVHWYQPDRLAVTNAVWLGQAAASVKLELKKLPEEADEVWGEVSADGGESWQRWDGFELRQGGEVVTGVFALPDSTPRQFRLRAANEREHRYWASEPVLLPKEEGEPSDQGGTRGGGIAIVPPDRTPEPAPSAAPTPSPEPASVPTPAPTPAPTPVPVPTPAPSPEAVPQDPLAEGEKGGGPGPVPQVLLAAAGAAVCALAGVFAARGKRK